MGLSAEGYLGQMAADFGLTSELNLLNSRLAEYEKTSGAGAFWWLSVFLSKHGPSQGYPHEPYWVNPLPALDGSHPHGYRSGVIPALILGILDNHPSYDTDLRAKKVVRALEEMQYHFRHSKNNAPSLWDSDGVELLRRRPDGTLEYADTGGPVTEEVFEQMGEAGSMGWLGWPDDPSDAFRTDVWDDGVLWPEGSAPRPAMSHDRLSSTVNDELHQMRRDAYLAFQPLGFSWLSTSNLQGLVYARGDLRAEGNFRVVGSLVTLGDLELGPGTELIFSEEYRRLYGLRTPLGILDYEEL